MHYTDGQPFRQTGTRIEREASGLYDLTTGHVWFTPSVDQQAALDRGRQRSVALRESATKALEVEFASAFYALAGQSYEAINARPRVQYSASIAVETAAKALTASGIKRVGLICPTFDAIAHLLHRQHLQLVPIAPDEMWSDPSKSDEFNLDAIFVVEPNNPTGQAPTAHEFERLASYCAHKNIVLVVDASFRFQSQTFYDQYIIAASTPGLRAIFIEDTGKTWPTKGKNVGIIAATVDLQPVVSEIVDEVQYGVAPETLCQLIELITLDAKLIRSGPTHLESIVAINRDVLRRALSRTQLSSATPTRMGVEWIRLPDGWDAKDFCIHLDDAGVNVIPGSKFDWDGSDASSRFFRVSLLRNPEEIRAAGIIIAQVANEFSLSLANGTATQPSLTHGLDHV